MIGWSKDDACPDNIIMFLLSHRQCRASTNSSGSSALIGHCVTIGTVYINAHNYVIVLVSKTAGVRGRPRDKETKRSGGNS